ncbi:MAG TPA: hypothetical protein VGI34_07085 [Candidatus Acidoferrales bacterium]
MMIMGAVFILVLIVALGYAALRIRRRRNNTDSTDPNRGFRPSVGFTRLDGMESISLLLSNESDENVWAEEIEIFLNGLVAEDQTSEPSFHGIQKIRQMVPRGDMLPISLAGAIYKAAGEPQRRHDSVLSSVLRYRIGEALLEKNLQNYRIEMIGLTAASVRRERRPVPPFQRREKPEPVEAMVAKLK